MPLHRPSMGAVGSGSWVPGMTLLADMLEQRAMLESPTLHQLSSPYVIAHRRLAFLMMAGRF